MARSRAVCVLAVVAMASSLAVAVEPHPAAGAIDQGFVLTLGSPLEDIGGEADAGSLTLIPRNPNNGDLWLDQTVVVDEHHVGGTAVAGNEFGAAVALGDITGDNSDDLVIGAPGADRDRGRVYVVPFLPATHRFDFAHATLVRAGYGGIGGRGEVGDRFGSSLAMAQSANGPLWLAVGAPNEDIGAVLDAGAVWIIPGGTSGADDVVLWQGAGAPGAPETGDRFGSSLARYWHTTNHGLAVGVPGENVGAIVDAGEVDLLLAAVPGLPGSMTGEVVREDRGTGPGQVEAGDRFGSSVIEIFGFGGVGQLAISSPYEDVGSAIDAGSVSIYRGFGDLMQQFTQNSVNIAGSAETGDHFGSAILYSDISLSIGVPGEDLGSVRDAGGVHILYAEGGNPFGGLGSLFITQDTAGVPNISNAGDAFGAALTPTGNAVAIAAPGESRLVARAGAVTIVFREPGGNEYLPAGAVFIDQDTTGNPGVGEVGDAFGSGHSVRIGT